MGRMIVLILTLCSLVSATSAAWREKVLYSFQGGTDGSTPAGGVIFDKAGNLYGETIEGGSTNCPPGWCGTVYELSPPQQKGGQWTEKVLWVFKGHDQNDGSSPSGGLIADSAGNLYGVTGYGGSGPCVLFGTATGCGTVFEMLPPKSKGSAWTEKVLYNFQGGKDGDLPSGPLVFDSAGNLYGATEFGGGKGTTCNAFYGGNCGMVFKLSPPKTKGGKWAEKLLHSFAGIAQGKQYGDGAVPNGGLLLDSIGTIYGTTLFGGSGNGLCQGTNGFDGCGTVFALRPPSKKGGRWHEERLHTFHGSPSDASGPNGGLVLSNSGELYGTTVGGGAQEDGVVFELNPPPVKGGSWKESLLHTFAGGNDGSGPLAGLHLGPMGNLYGTATGGLTAGGLIFVMKPPPGHGAWSFEVLRTLKGPPDGYDPLELTFGKGGAIFSSTLYGGTGQCQGGCGTVFRTSP